MSCTYNVPIDRDLRQEAGNMLKVKAHDRPAEGQRAKSVNAVHTS